MVEPNYGGLDKTQVNLWISKDVNDISLNDEGAEKLKDIFDQFRNKPTREFFMYQKVGNVYQASQWEFIEDLELLNYKRGLLCPSKLVDFAQDFLLNQRDFGNVNMITYPQALPKMKNLCDEILIVDPHPDYNPHSTPRPHYEIELMSR